MSIRIHGSRHDSCHPLYCIEDEEVRVKETT